MHILLYCRKYVLFSSCVRFAVKKSKLIIIIIIIVRRGHRFSAPPAKYFKRRKIGQIARYFHRGPYRMYIGILGALAALCIILCLTGFDNPINTHEIKKKKHKYRDGIFHDIRVPNYAYFTSITVVHLFEYAIWFLSRRRRQWL
jgi:hypothetical protein